MSIHCATVVPPAPADRSKSGTGRGGLFGRLRAGHAAGPCPVGSPRPTMFPSRASSRFTSEGFRLPPVKAHDVKDLRAMCTALRPIRLPRVDHVPKGLFQGGQRIPMRVTPASGDHKGSRRENTMANAPAPLRAAPSARAACDPLSRGMPGARRRCAVNGSTGRRPAQPPQGMAGRNGQPKPGQSDLSDPRHRAGHRCRRRAPTGSRSATIRISPSSRSRSGAAGTILPSPPRSTPCDGASCCRSACVQRHPHSP